MSSSTAEKFNADSAAAPSQLYVINLCSSTSPMALSHPSAPELKRYTFFVGRQREEGRERFRLHMGYFSSQEEAEKLLDAVRDVYPAAWAGLAPAGGAPRRNRVAVAPAPEVALVPAVATVVVPESVSVVPAVAVLDSISNVRDVLAQLSEVHPAAPPALMPVAASGLSDVQVLHVLEASVAASVAAQVAPVRQVSTAEREAVRAAPRVPVVEPPTVSPMVHAEVRLVTPEDTQTLTDIRLDAENNAPPCFAIQLIWSVTPIDVLSLPHLAIFDAYTLYNVEGSREGRKWFGLRLGFFSEPNSATQVANYVRSDYRSVSVVPVAIKERDRAAAVLAPKSSSGLRSAGAAAQPKADVQQSLNTESLDGFELLPDEPAPAKRDLDDKPAPVAMAPKAAVKAAPPVVAPKAKGKPTGKRVVVRKRPDAVLSRTAPGAATPLESTLEILGASTLTLDDSRAIINDSVVRKPIVKKPSGNRFSMLLSRLSGN